MDEKELKALMDGIAQKNSDAIKDAVTKQMEALKAGLLTIEQYKADLETIGLKPGVIKTLVDAVEKQGIEIRKFNEGKPHAGKTIDEMVAEKSDAIKAIATGGGPVKLNINKTLVNTCNPKRLNTRHEVAGRWTISVS